MDPHVARQRLQAHRDELARTLAGLQEDAEAQKDSLSELSMYDQHPADVGTETFEREKSESIIESLRAALDDVDRAFHRLEQGSYGTCEVCGATIDDDRLEAVPATRFCVEHQARSERLTG